MADRVKRLDAAFCCGGSVVLPEPVVLGFRGPHTVVVQRDDPWSRPRRPDPEKALLRQCEPAPFGVGRETRHDPRVREGGQLLAAEGALRVMGLDLQETGILAAVRDVLCPDDAALPEAELHALNVYTARGHFVRHKDTPRDPACFGTLVVCLPLRFRGGRLVLHHETTKSYAWEDRAAYPRSDEPYRVHWAAFYGDVDHEIERVTGGTRITLTWLLRRGAGGVPRPSPAGTEAELQAALARALADPRFLPEGGVLGVPCLHLYSQASLPTEREPSPARARASRSAPRSGSRSGQARGRPSGSVPNAGLFPAVEAADLSVGEAAGLKGRDRLVAQAALSAGLRVRHRPYLYESSVGENWRLSRTPTEKEVAIFGQRRLGASKLERTMPIEHATTSWDRDDDVTWIAKPPWHSGWRRYSWHDPLPDAGAEPALALLASIEYSATDYFGNEGGDVTFYAAAAILITVPPARERELGASR